MLKPPPSLRGVRKLERSLEVRTDLPARVLLDYCLAVRGALTDDGRPPLAASGLKLRRRIQEVEGSLARVITAKKGRKNP
ncbi:hypothetical protein [Deinococcus aetherius]|uniref:hypothetical protein n=1 Tax=Deinococcus aetherius TaxID=200252 RepID=UPI0022314D9A|nr:hypothetical protein [Deinococcus aetherius]